jgi:hypothetical protein
MSTTPRRRLMRRATAQTSTPTRVTRHARAHPRDGNDGGGRSRDTPRPAHPRDATTALRFPGHQPGHGRRHVLGEIGRGHAALAQRGRRVLAALAVQIYPEPGRVRR